MKAISIGALALVAGMTSISGPAAGQGKEKRCGWIANPTPANWTLQDRDGEWLLGAQGSYQAPGLDRIPDLTTSQWVVTNGSSYGYGCACMSVATNRRSRRVTRLFSIQQLPLKTCRADKTLPKP